MGKHTPGPWRIKVKRGAPDHKSEILAKFTDADGIKFGHWIVAADVRWCDALLVSMAPDMLEALKDLVRTNGKKNKLWDEVRALIAKAEGESW